MKPVKREWMLNVSLILYWFFNFSQQAFLLGTEISQQQRILVYNFHNLGMVLGGLLLPLLLPLGVLREKENHRDASSHLSRYTLRLTIVGFFFLPNIIVRLLGVHAWMASSFNSAFMAIGNGAAATLLLGCFINLSGNKRPLWYALAYSMSYTLYNLVVGLGRKQLLALMFPSAGVFLTCAGVLILIFLAGIKPNPQDEAYDPSTPVPDTQINAKGFNPLCILPAFAAAVIFGTNSLTDWLFFPTLNTHFPPGFHPTVVVFIFALPVLGFLAYRWQNQFCIVFISISSFLFLLIPSLLFFSHSAPLFLVLYTLNLIMIQMMTQFFPIVIVDMYWQKKTNGRGYWAWLLAVAIYMIRAFSFSMVGPFKALSLDNAHAVILLSIAAIAYYLLSQKSIGNIRAAVNATALSAVSAKSMEESFKEYGLSEREMEVALLMAQEGLSAKEMGERLFISPLTVRDHTSSVYRKFGVKGRAEFMAVIVRMSRPSSES